VVAARSTPRTLGCLILILIGVTIAYFGFNVGEVYLRFYRFRDAIEQETRFARQRDDETIRRRLTLIADSLGLPEAAARIKVHRSAHQIEISSEWSEHVELPMFVREFRFTPRVSGPL